jgi:hypothetical protein
MDGPGHLMLVIERTHLGAQILGAILLGHPESLPPICIGAR